MATINGMERDARLRTWAAAICECKGSGKTVVQWCLDTGLSVKTYYYRYKQVCNALGNDFQHQECPVAGQSLIEPAQTWLPVRIEAKEKKADSPVLLRIGRCELELNEGIDTQWLAQVIKAVASAC